MPFSLSWTIEGEQELSRQLLGVETNLRDFTRPLTTIAKNLTDLFSTEVFSSDGAVLGERWARLSPYTVAQKARSGWPPDTLVRTGAMKAGFKSIVTSDQATLYNTQDYFKYHQSNQPRFKLPRRVMMKLGNNQKEMIVKEFQRFIKEAK